VKGSYSSLCGEFESSHARLNASHLLHFTRP